MAAPLLPHFSTDASTAFLQLLQSKDYVGWYVFDSSRDSSALWKSVAMMLLWHSGVNYPEVGKFLEVSWRPKIKEILEVDQRYLTQCGEQKYGQPEYWTDIGAACMGIAIEFFTHNGKPDQADIVRQGRCPTTSNKTAYSALAAFLQLCLCWYECRADGSVVTHLFHNETKGDIALFANVAQEGDRFYLLWHKDFKFENVTIGFPYAMKVKERGEPIVLGCKLQQSNPVSDPKDALIQSLVKLIDNSAGLTLKLCTAIPPEAGEQFRGLQGALNVVKSLISSAKLQYDVVPASLSQLLSLPTSSQPSPVSRGPHTITTCEQFPEDADFVTYHAHSFHRSCLTTHLEGLKLKYPELPNCPVCGERLPDVVLDVSPTVRFYYEESRKSATTHVSTGSRTQHLFGNLTLPPQNSTIQCALCHNQYDRQYFISHGCIVCMMCSLRSYNEGRMCGMCRQAFREDEVTALTSFYYQTYGGNR